MPPLFDVVLGIEDVVDPEKDCKVHARAGVIFGIEPSACVVIEDSVSGVADAVACGIGRVIGFAHSLEADKLRAAGAHEIITHLADVRLTENE
jgi:beta-phosphoglucomutase-like phosphatase (HAD superfamily)